ncbi:MAG: hypothetical protein ABIS03_02055, partial [Gemmatimonadaceae bacterium]
MTRGRFASLLLSLATGGISLGMPPVVANAQLRPLEAQPWPLVSGGSTITAALGISGLRDQRASLAGTSGDLFEIGNVSLAWRTGRVVLEIAGTVQRWFDETTRFAEPYRDVVASDDERRHDSGDYRIATSVRFTPVSFPVDGTFRFGTRLPTTDNTTGLDRDAIDFYATVGGQFRRTRARLGGELGLGIFSTREAQFEQEDLLLYEFHAEYAQRLVAPFASVV